MKLIFQDVVKYAENYGGMKRKNKNTRTPRFM